MSLNQLVRAPLAAMLIAGASLSAPVTLFAQEASAPAAATTDAAASDAAAAPAADTAAATATDTATPADVTPPTAPEVEHQVVENPYGVGAMLKGGDFVTRGNFIILMIMSLGSWYIIFTKLFEQSKLFKSAKEASQDFWAAGSIKNGVGKLKDGSAFRYIAEQGLKSAEHHEGTLVEQIDLNTWVGMSIQRAVDNVQSRMQDGLAFLATVGSTAPFVGLFGTVWGIYNALTKIGMSGQASIDKVAGPVGEALIMTAFGLFVAVPAVMGYNWLIRRNKGAMERVRAFSGDLHNVLLAGTAKVVR
jgi:biopolymer transport protein ExbB